ncbi:hypothetical protein C8Q74DRAFT_1347097 [Fomes fomentarius]|nr:hypothetical protein C8Q74DRAFT_1347097 [Fomes fomentarius]
MADYDYDYDYDYDSTFHRLPPALKQRIDRAFDVAIDSPPHPFRHPRKRRRLDQDVEKQHGGFIVDDIPAGGFLPEDFAPEEDGFVQEESSAPGGFIPDDLGQDGDKAHIPMSLIPSALQLLDLPPNDEDALSVFRNAASGWGQSSRNAQSASHDSEDPLVSRKDWRAVCTALLDTGATSDDVDMADASMPVSGDDGDVAEEVSDSAEEYIQSSGSDIESGDDSDSDYQEGGFVRASRPSKTSAKVARTSSSAAQTRRTRTERESLPSSSTDSGEDSVNPHRLTARQRKECRAAFALFFPNMADKDLEKQRIGIKNVTRVAELLKEKISAEETLEMLEAFSTAPDKSMGLVDFERMMIAAKLA